MKLKLQTKQTMIRLSSLLLVLFTVFLSNTSFADCGVASPNSSRIQVPSTITYWSQLADLTACDPQLTTDGGVYTGNVYIYMASGRSLIMDIDLTIYGNLSIINNGSNDYVVIAADKVVKIVGDMGDITNNNVIFKVEAGGILIVTGQLQGKNNNALGGSGTLSAGSVNFGVNLTCDAGGCPTLSISQCNEPGDACALNNSGSANCSNQGYGGAVTSDQTNCAGAFDPALLTSSGSTGYLLRWEKSVDAGATWTGLNNIAYTYDPPVTSVSTKFRVVVLNVTGAPCNAYSIPANIITGVPSAAGAITGNATVCLNTAGYPYSVAPISFATSYTWAYTGSGVTQNGTGNSITLDFSGSATAGNLTVFGTNVCGNGTTSPTKAIAVSASAAPTVNQPTSQSLCNGVNTTAVTFTGTGASSYSWVNNNTSVGLGASGSGTSIGIFNATNTQVINPNIATVTVTPVSAGCRGIPKTFTYTVRSSGSWLGGISTDWSTAGNWCGGIPNSTTSTANIATGSTFQPTLSANTSCFNLNIGTGATVTIGTRTFTVNGQITGDGTITGSSTSNLTLATSTTNAGALYMNQTSASTKSLQNLTLNKTSLSIFALGDTLNLVNTLNLSNGIFNTGNKLKLYSTASRTGRIGVINSANASIVGNIIAERYEGRTTTNWAYLGSPVTNATIADWTSPWSIGSPATSFGFPTSGFNGATGPAGTSGFNSVYTYDETVAGTSVNGYVPATNVTNPLTTGKGFMVYLGRSFGTTTAMKFRVTGTPQVGPFAFPVSYTASAGVNEDGWNLIANPYPSEIDIDFNNGANWTANNMDDAIYIMKDDGNYASYVSGSGSNGGSQYIASHQGFLVKANAASPTLSITENAKVATNPSYFKASNNASEFSNIRIQLTKLGNLNSDETVVKFDDRATVGFDSKFDAVKLNSINANAVNISTITNNAEFSINTMPAIDVNTIIPVKIKLAGNGVYTIRLSDMEVLINDNSSLFINNKLVLENLQTNEIININGETNYSFTCVNNEKVANFILRFENQNITTTVNKLDAFDLLHIKSRDGEFFVDADAADVKNITVQLFNSIGQEAKAPVQFSSKSGLQKIDTSNLTSGIYFINVTTNNKTISKKINID